jgi:signal transduction histidine kinase
MMRSNLSRIGPPILAIGMLLLALGFGWLRMSSPSDGTRLEPDAPIWRPDGVLVTLLASQPDGLQPGDMVVAANGTRLTAWADNWFVWVGPVPSRYVGQTVTYSVQRGERRQDVHVTLVRYPWDTVLVQHWGVGLMLLLLQVVGTFVLLRGAHEQAARLLFLSCSGVVAGGTAWILGLQVQDLLTGLPFWLYRLPLRAAYLLGAIALLHLALVWPARHSILARRPALIPLIYLVPFTLYAACLLLALPGTPTLLAWIGRWQALERPFDSVPFGLGVLVMVVSYLHAPRASIARLQLRWIVFALTLAGSLGIGLATIPELIWGYALVDWNLIGLLWLPVPLSIAVAVLRYRLFDIDRIINRTLVYGTLTLTIAGIYVAVVIGFGALLRTGDNLLVSLLATVLVAILFQPVRERLQRAANRLLYGERDEPYLVLSRLGQRLESTNAPTTILPAIVDTVAQALKLPYVAIALQQRETLAIAAAAGHPGAADLIALPLVFQTETVGQLVVAPRSPGEAFTPADRRLLADIAHQASGAAYAVRLTADLQRSRESLVTAREEERRRLRRDLHDGLGPRLAGLVLRIETARNLLAHEPLADPLLADLQEQTEAAIAEIRRLVYALRPPALDQLGLVSALREQATVCSTHGLRVVVDAPEQLPPLPAAVEVAAYRIALEALTNIVRHAQAHTCCIRFSLDGALQLEITDDGRGLPAEVRAGVGLTSMQERAVELGGTWSIERLGEHGTRVLARLPLLEGAA